MVEVGKRSFSLPKHSGTTRCKHNRESTIKSTIHDSAGASTEAHIPQAVASLEQKQAAGRAMSLLFEPSTNRRSSVSSVNKTYGGAPRTRSAVASPIWTSREITTGRVYPVLSRVMWLVNHVGICGRLTRTAERNYSGILFILPSTLHRWCGSDKHRGTTDEQTDTEKETGL